MKTINALERGLDVLRKLDERHGQSLAELHAATGIPKPSLLRILDTLEASGFAWRAIGDGRYRRRFALILRPSLADELLAIGEIAAPFLESLRRKVIWPSDVLVFRDFRMELVETSRRQSTLGVAMYPLGYRVEMFLSAPGRAYLAFCSDAEREAVLADAALNPPCSSAAAKCCGASCRPSSTKPAASATPPATRSSAAPTTRTSASSTTASTPSRCR
jgi:IclR family mhp operon transcriptional activator